MRTQNAGCATPIFAPRTYKAWKGRKLTIHPAAQIRRFMGKLNHKTILLLLPLLLLAACSGDTIISSEQEAGGPEYSAIIITSDLAVGPNRILFGIINRDGMPVPGPSAEVESYFMVPGAEERELKESLTVPFINWPTSVLGVFGAPLDFDTAGLYQLDINYTSNEGTPIFAQGNLLIKESASTPAIGAAAPTSVTNTAANAEDIFHITSASNPDLDLYQYSVHEALEQAKPLVVVFATPAFCLSATCGPQVAQLTSVKESVGDLANYIHVEVFEEPHEIEDQRPTGGLVPAVREWGLPTEPWTFIIDAQGLVHAKFEQFATAEEIEEKLLELF